MTVLNVSLLSFFHCLRKRVGGKYLKLNVLFPLLLLATGKSYSNQRAASESRKCGGESFRLLGDSHGGVLSTRGVVLSFRENKCKIPCLVWENSRNDCEVSIPRGKRYAQR